jgi:hypothetical protein
LALVVAAAIFEPMVRQGKPLLDYEREMAQRRVEIGGWRYYQ